MTVNNILWKLSENSQMKSLKEFEEVSANVLSYCKEI
mgnify:CR=1 FL=1